VHPLQLKDNAFLGWRISPCSYLN